MLVPVKLATGEVQTEERPFSRLCAGSLAPAGPLRPVVGHYVSLCRRIRSGNGERLRKGPNERLRLAVALRRAGLRAGEERGAARGESLGLGPRARPGTHKKEAPEPGSGASLESVSSCEICRPAPTQPLLPFLVASALCFSSSSTALRESLILLPSLPMHLTITCWPSFNSSRTSLTL